MRLIKMTNIALYVEKGALVEIVNVPPILPVKYIAFTVIKRSVKNGFFKRH